MQPPQGLKNFFANRRNLIMVLVIVIVLGLLWLFKDVFVVAVVNGQPIYRWTVVKQLESQGGAQVLDTLVIETLARQAVSKAGVTVDQAQIDTYVTEVEARATEQGSTLDDLLAQQGMTRAQWLDNLRLQRQVEQLVASNITVSEEEITQYIADNGDLLPIEATEQELRDLAREQIYSTKISEAIQAWLQELRDNAQIMYLKEYQAPALY